MTADPRRAQTSFRAAIEAGDFADALALDHERLARVAGQMMSSRGGALVGAGDGEANERLALADSLIEHIAALRALTAGAMEPAIDSRAATYGLLCGAIGHIAGRLGIDQPDAFGEAIAAMASRNGARARRANAVGTRNAWREPALGIARRMREEDPAAAATSIARCIRRALSPHYRNLPQLSHIASRILPDWERQGALSARAREPAVSPAR